MSCFKSSLFHLDVWGSKIDPLPEKVKPGKPGKLNCLVVFRQPLWKMMELKSVGMTTFPTEWKNEIHVPNHQSVKVYKKTLRRNQKKPTVGWMFKYKPDRPLDILWYILDLKNTIETKRDLPFTEISPRNTMVFSSTPSDLEFSSSQSLGFKIKNDGKLVAPNLECSCCSYCFIAYERFNMLNELIGYVIYKCVYWLYIQRYIEIIHIYIYWLYMSLSYYIQITSLHIC